VRLIYHKHLQQFEQHCAARDPAGEVSGHLETLMLRNACNQPSELGDAEAAQVLGGMLVANAKRGPPSGPGAADDEDEPPNKRRRLTQARSSAVSRTTPHACARRGKWSQCSGQSCVAVFCSQAVAAPSPLSAVASTPTDITDSEPMVHTRSCEAGNGPDGTAGPPRRPEMPDRRRKPTLTSDRPVVRQIKPSSKRSASRSAPGAVKVPHNINTLVCELCGGGHHEEKIILCDVCDRGCHMFCLDPPMSAVPRGDWTCPLCTADEAATSNAFQEGDETTLASFEQAAASFKSGWWGDEVRQHASTPCYDYSHGQLFTAAQTEPLIFGDVMLDSLLLVVFKYEVGALELQSLLRSIEIMPCIYGRSQQRATSSRSSGGSSRTATRPWMC